ncbi:hypothetical protein G6Z34_13075 [Clostridium perfringens]|uniref:Uncharacterized protein n=1 Tax=Clostridium perfringens TaxID=1502 RepID=A0AAP6WPY9_CLOPF|nr:hypothetical protein [Clostridium perfringens]NGU31017.1 hypothetical protein [Clostridium perfringens]
MIIKKWNGKARFKCSNKEEVFNMTVMAKPMNGILTIREDKVEEFLNQKRDDKMWEKIKEKSALFRRNMTK